MWSQEEKDVGFIARDQAHLSGKRLVWLTWARSLDCCWLGLSLQETAVRSCSSLGLVPSPGAHTALAGLPGETPESPSATVMFAQVNLNFSPWLHHCISNQIN